MKMLLLSLGEDTLGRGWSDKVRELAKLDAHYDPQAWDPDPVHHAETMVELMQDSEYMSERGYGWLAPNGALLLLGGQATLDTIVEDARDEAIRFRQDNEWLFKNYDLDIADYRERRYL